MPDQLALQMNDVQPKAGPALSATSDMPEVKAAPPPISEEVNGKPTEGEKPAETEKPDAEKPSEGEKPEGEKHEAGGEDGEEAKLPANFKAQITRQRSLKRAAEARAEKAEKLATEATANLTKALEGIETLTKVQASKISEEAEKADPRPARDAYDDPAKYESDLVDWAGRRAALVAKADSDKAVTDALAKEKTDTQAKADKARNDATLEAFAERKAKFIEDHPDYESLVESEEEGKELQISISMANCILNDEDGPAIAYYLGQNPDEATRISKLPGVQAISALGRIAARLAQKPAPATKPAPLKVLKTGSETAVRKTAEEESMAEYGARRQRELANEARTRRGMAPLN